MSMSVLDVDGLLAPVSPDAPCGADLEYDREFSALERMAQGRAEQQMGDRVLPATDPEWKQLVPHAQTLLGRTKDLRIAAYLAKALLRVNGLAGFADGVKLMRGFLEQYWPSVYPQLDHDDDDDPTMRVTAVAGLADPPTVVAIQRAPLVTSAIGSVSLRDFAVARGELQPTEGQTPPDMGSIEAAFQAVPFPDLEGRLAVLQGLRDDVAGIESLLVDKAGGGRAANLSRLTDLLDQAVTLVGARVQQRRPVADAPHTAANGASAGRENGAGAPAGMGVMPGQIRSREDVLAALDQVIDYYKRHEPSSPVPLLVGRAKRLAKMTFMDIVKDMAPDAMSQVTLIGGSESDEEPK
jgi:type VI secretion system protein ImpA